MNIISGLFPNCVLQRTPRDRSDARIRLEVATAGDLRMRVTSNNRPVPGFRDRKLAVARKGTVEFRLAGVPVGGPYRVELTIGPRARLVVTNVLVGDVWLAAGQSNMQGCGRLEYAAKPVPLVRAFYMDDRWDVARDPIHNMAACVDQVHIDLCGGVRPGRNTLTGTGPAVAFAQEMWRRTGIPQGVIASAHGGTSMDQWDPAKKHESSKSLYGAMLRRLEKNGGRCAGMIWYQGETEALTPGWPELYTTKMVRFIRAVRRDVGQRDLPVALVQLSRVVGQPQNGPGWNSVQDQQRRLPARLPRVTVVPAVDLQLEDTIHLGGPDNNRLGRRLAQAMAVLTGEARRGEKPPIAVRKLALKSDPRTGAAQVVVQFGNVTGRLVAPGRPSGFSAGDTIYHTVLDGARVILNLTSATALMSGASIRYGDGTDPYCNITDEADRSLPVFGPLQAGRPRALTPFIRRLRATSLLPGAGQLDGLGCPANLESLPWRTVESGWDLCDLHLDFGAAAPQDRLVYYSGRLDVPEPMKLRVLLGYDGPVKLWVDGRELFHDPHGTNPAIPDRAKRSFTAEPGPHTVVVALGSNQGRAWGIYLRFERVDVPVRVIKQGPDHYRLPTLTV